MPPKIQARLQTARALFARLETSNHYEILEIPNTADTAGIRKAFRNHARSFHVDGFARYELSDEDRRIIQQVFIAVNRASEILSDPAKRREYDLGLEQGHTQGAPPAGAQMDRLFEAERQVREAISLIRNGKAPSAVARLEKALEVTGDDPLALAAKIYAENLVVQSRGAAPQTAARARDELIELLEGYQARAEPFVYLGRLHKALGQKSQAMEAFKRALKIDPRANEAASELRHLQRDNSKSKPSTQAKPRKGGGLFSRRKK